MAYYTQAEIAKYREEIGNQTDATIDSDGVVRWKSNGRVVPADILKATGLFTAEQLAVNDVARDAEFVAFLADYRASMAERTPEQIAEHRAQARAAHGPGVVLVDVFTGERFKT